MAKRIPTIILLICIVAISSCNTYKWQKKRYYSEDKTENWNNYNKEKTKEDQDQRIRKEYYKD